MKHPVFDYFALSAACEINDKHNEKMLREGRYIPWWKRHLLLTIGLVVASPVILIGALIILVNLAHPSDGAAAGFGTFLGWAIPIGIVVGGVVAYTRAESRWKREVNKPTKVIDIR